MLARWTSPRHSRVLGKGLNAVAATTSSASASQRSDLLQLPSSHVRFASKNSSSNSRWKQRQGKDSFAREAKVQGLKSRAAFKLLEMDAKYRLFKRGQMVIDLGYAPGSWSQVAADSTKPNGRVIGIDLLPAQPPKGVSTIQGNFLSPAVQQVAKQLIVDTRRRQEATPPEPEDGAEEGLDQDDAEVISRPSYIDQEREAAADDQKTTRSSTNDAKVAPSKKDRLVDVVLSDMSAPWPQTTGFSVNTISNAYARLMNTSGVAFKDHAGSMDLCNAALEFASDTLRAGGHFVCKFYQGAEDKLFENKLKKMFSKVHREKPESSRSESKEAYFVALRRKAAISLEDIEAGQR